ncbi:MAG: type II toxin-antitoxin system Phd/YefM family antitoxin [Roseiarcus sp.]|uniref:type II toxin-antitoxin system Phd/YefM family antitoxin n=1 Tax=Roseiarcus sp. TaxID=1969460 RepID=UPI003C172937
MPELPLGATLVRVSQGGAMPIVNMLEAKTHLSRLVEEVESGATSEIVIARNGKPAARLVPIGAPAPVGKRLGLLEGRYPSSSQAEFDAANDAIARLFRARK